jgi:exopolysaccharide biosynthesis protein
MSTPLPPPRTAASAPPSPGGRRRRWPKRVAIGASAVLLVAGGIAWWALDEYVIDHVVITDVAAHEAAALAASSTTASAASATTRATVATVAAASATTTAPSTTVPASSTPAGALVVASAAGAGATVTRVHAYAAGATSIVISKVVTGSGSSAITYFVADVVVADGTALRSGFADNKFGENIIADTSEIAADVGAVFAVNGDYYGFRSSGIMIRNGVIYRDDPARTGLAIYRDGRMEVYDETTTSAQALLDAGVWSTLSFGPALVDDGQVVNGITDVEVDTNVGNHSIQGNQPRTALGVVAPNHFVFVVVDGRKSGYSRGVTLPELAAIFQRLGATEAYNLDGGGSSTMWFDGALVNDPLGKGQERGTSDILYVA